MWVWCSIQALPLPVDESPDPGRSSVSQNAYWRWRHHGYERPHLQTRLQTHLYGNRSRWRRVHQCQRYFFNSFSSLHQWKAYVYLGVYGSEGGGGMWRSWRAELLVGVPEGVAEPLPGLLVGYRHEKTEWMEDFIVVRSSLNDNFGIFGCKMKGFYFVHIRTVAFQTSRGQ